MIKTFMLATPNPKHTREECQDYLGNRHPRHAMSVESLSDTFKLYSMNFVQLEDQAAFTTLCPRRDDFMMAVEICTESRESYETALEDPEYLMIVRPDEGYMIGEFQGSAPIFYQVEEEVLYAQESPRRTGEYRVLDFLVAKEGASADELISSVESNAADLAQDLLFRAVANGLVVNRVMDMPTLFGLPAGQEAVIIETRADDLETLADYYRRLGTPTTDHVDMGKSFSLVTRMKVIH